MKLDLVLAVTLLSSVLACSSGGQGGERQACYGNGTCNVGLTCFSNVCVNATGSGGASGSTGGGSGGAGGGAGVSSAGGRGGVAGNAGVAGSAGSGGVTGAGASAGTTGVAGVGGGAGTGGVTGAGGSAGAGGRAGTSGVAGAGGVTGTGGVAGASGSTGAGGSAGVAGAGGSAGTGGAGGSSSTCWVGDFDGDGAVDCAMPGPGASDLSFFKGTSGGYSTTPVVTSSILPNGYALLHAPFDMTGDGRDDLAFRTFLGQWVQLYTIFGNADGTFSTSTNTFPFAEILPGSITPASASGSFAPASAHTDLFIPTVVIGQQGTIPAGEVLWVVLFANPLSQPPGAAITDAGFSSLSRGSIVGSAAVGDVDGDHNLDAIAIINSQTMTGLFSPQVYIAFGNGDRTFRPGKNVVSGTLGATSVQTADMNADGKLDLLVGLAGGTTIFYGDGVGGFSTTAP
jgi:hypothetical protein